MASAFPGYLNAFQVGNFFVGQYYHYLQQKPDHAHQFYDEASTVIRCDGPVAETATGTQQIHDLIMSLNFMVIEIITANSLESWNGGVLVMVSGLMKTRDYCARRKFVQTFFLAPQKKGYFVLNDIFHFLEEEQLHQDPPVLLGHSNFENNLNASDHVLEPVSEYVSREEIQDRDFVPQVHVEENDTIDEYNIPEPQQEFYQVEERTVENFAEEPAASFPNTMNAVRDQLPVPAASFPNTMNAVRDQLPVPAEEPVGEQPKKTYASILRIAKGPPEHSVSHPATSNKSTPVASEWNHVPQQSHSNLSSGPQKPEATEEVIAHEDEGEASSVYVGNLPSSITTSDLEQEFKNFGRIRPDGVTIRSRKETGVFYAFIEFEDTIAVQNALKASPVQLNDHLIHVEGRRPNSGAPRGRRGGRGGRGRFGIRALGRGYSQRSGRPERGGNQASRNGYSQYEASYY